MPESSKSNLENAKDSLELTENRLSLKGNSDYSDKLNPNQLQNTEIKTTPESDLSFTADSLELTYIKTNFKGKSTDVNESSSYSSGNDFMASNNRTFNCEKDSNDNQLPMKNSNDLIDSLSSPSEQVLPEASINKVEISKSDPPIESTNKTEESSDSGDSSQNSELLTLVGKSCLETIVKVIKFGFYSNNILY